MFKATLGGAITLAAIVAASPAALAQSAAPSSIKVGYAISKSGPNAGGAAITQIPNYVLWVKDVNAKGGIMMSSIGKRLPVEVIEYDDRSNAEEAVRGVERLITQDKVDFVFPPWGTGLNLAVGPTFNKYGYPQLTFSAVTDRAPELAKRWPNSFWMLGTSSQYIDGLVELLVKKRGEGAIGPNVAMISVADGFGIDLSGAARPRLEKAGFKLAYDKSYPVGTQDVAPLISEAQKSGADTFIAFSYPPDTIALTEQSKLVAYAPKVMFMGVGTGFPLYPARFGANAEGIISLGGWSKDNAGLQDYVKRHKEVTGNEPDRWGSQLGYASLQMLEQSIERVGKIDREAIIKELQTGTFDTIVGKIKLENNMPKDAIWLIGQWQNGFFTGVAPQRAGVATLSVPKAPWK